MRDTTHIRHCIRCEIADFCKNLQPRRLSAARWDSLPWWNILSPIRIRLCQQRHWFTSMGCLGISSSFMNPRIHASPRLIPGRVSSHPCQLDVVLRGGFLARCWFSTSVEKSHQLTEFYSMTGAYFRIRKHLGRATVHGYFQAPNTRTSISTFSFDFEVELQSGSWYLENRKWVSRLHWDYNIYI